MRNPTKAMMSCRIDRQLLQRLDDVAAMTKPSRSGIVISLIEKFLDEPIAQALAPSRPTSMPIECAWCGEPTGEKDGQGITGTTTTICKPCLRHYFPRQAKRMLQRVHGD